MKKIIIMPDSFKGTMASPEVIEIIKSGLLRYFKPEDIITIPIADGGEGTVDCFMRFTNADRISVSVKGPLMNDIIASYGIFDGTAIVETASAAGYTLSSHQTSPMDTTTYGVGQLIGDAINRGCKKIILGLGGSCTNDVGAGLASALGAKFLDSSRNSFVPTGKNLGEIHSIDLSVIKKRLEGIEIIGMCDITNPLYGEQGAAFIFAPQKGASPEEVVFLDQQLIHLSHTIQKCLHMDVSQLKGGGAAGGMGAGIHAFLGGKLLSGIDLLLDLVKFDELLDQCSVVVTGEGKLDRQSLGGKAVSGICRHAKTKKVPVVIMTGEKDPALGPLEPHGIHAVFETGKINWTKSAAEIQASCRKALRIQADALARYLKTL